MERLAVNFREPIKNGAKLSIGDKPQRIEIIVDQHFNWFQKKMFKWCFGFTVEDYEED